MNIETTLTHRLVNYIVNLWNKIGNYVQEYREKLTVHERELTLYWEHNSDNASPGDIVLCGVYEEPVTVKATFVGGIITHEHFKQDEQIITCHDGSKVTAVMNTNMSISYKMLKIVSEEDFWIDYKVTKELITDIRDRTEPYQRYKVLCTFDKKGYAIPTKIVHGRVVKRLY